MSVVFTTPLPTLFVYGSNFCFTLGSLAAFLPPVPSGPRSGAAFTWLPPPSRSSQVSYRPLALLTKRKTTRIAVTWAKPSMRSREIQRTKAGPPILVHRTSGSSRAATAARIAITRKGVPVRLITHP